MGHIIRAVRANLEGERFDWLIGASVSEIEFAEPCTWLFRFSGGGSCQMNGENWRLLTAGGMVATSYDHGQRFGLPAPVDTRANALAALGSARVLDARVNEAAPDLVIHFERGLVLELLALSRGYECWQTRDPSGRCLVVHGSRDASTWQDPSAN